MQHDSNGWFVGAIYGSIGLIQYMLQVDANEPYMAKLAGAIITAFLCGIAGGIGKWLIDYVKDKITKKNDSKH